MIQKSFGRLLFAGFSVLGQAGRYGILIILALVEEAKRGEDHP